MQRGRVQEWTDFYKYLFNFRGTLDVERPGGLKGRILAGPGGRIRILLNGSSEDRPQGQEEPDVFGGEGIGCVTLSTRDIATCVEALRRRGIEFVDAAPIEEDGGWGLRVATRPVVGSIFFEIVQRVQKSE